MAQFALHPFFSPSFLRLLDDLFRCSSSLTLSSQAFFLPVNQVTGVTIPLKRPCSTYILTFIQLWIDLISLYILALFDLHPAFHMVDHDILLQRLEPSCGIRGPLSFGSNPTLQMVDHLWTLYRTPWVMVKFGVLQCSALGPHFYWYKKVNTWTNF